MRILLAAMGLVLTACAGHVVVEEDVGSSEPEVCDLQADPGDMVFFADGECDRQVVVVSHPSAAPADGDLVCQPGTGARWTVSETFDAGQLGFLGAVPARWWFKSASGECVSGTSTLNLIMRDGDRAVLAWPVTGY